MASFLAEPLRGIVVGYIELTHSFTLNDTTTCTQHDEMTSEVSHGGDPHPFEATIESFATRKRCITRLAGSHLRDREARDGGAAASETRRRRRPPIQQLPSRWAPARRTTREQKQQAFETP